MAEEQEQVTIIIIYEFSVWIKFNDIYLLCCHVQRNGYPNLGLAYNIIVNVSFTR